MKKIYRIIILAILLIFLSTYNSIELNSTKEKKKNFLTIQEIEIINNFFIQDHEIEAKLKKIYNKNIFLIKREDIEKPLKEIDFFEKVEVKKKYPNTIEVKIFETEPIAILYKNKTKYLLDDLSNLILIKDNMNFNHLPSIFGQEAENNFLYFFNQLKKKNFPIKLIEKFYFFKIGRWDIQLKNDKVVKFPYGNIDEAIKKSIELLDRKDFENYDIIDLRIDGKIIVE